MTMDEAVKFRRHLSLWDATSLSIGIVVGSAIFITPSAVFIHSGQSVGWALVVWALCGLFSIIGSLCYSELGTTITRSGGDYVYILEAFGPLPSFLRLWAAILIIRPTTQAIMALTFAKYILTALMPLVSGTRDPVTDTLTEVCSPPDLAVRLVAALCLGFVSYINCRSVRWTMSLQGLFTAAKLLALTVIITAGLIHIFQGGTKYLEDPFRTTQEMNISLAFYSGLFAYGGWNYLNFVTEELKDPYRNLPRAAIMAITVVTGMYLLANVAYFAVLPSDEIMQTQTIAMLFASKCLGALAAVIPLTVAISTFGGVNGIMFTTARLICVGAQERQLPQVLGMLDVNHRTPSPALIFSLLASLLMLFTSDVFLLITYLSFTNWMFCGVSIAALIWLRHREPERKRPIKFPLALSYFFVAMCFLLTAFAVHSEPIQALVGSFILLCGVPVFYLIRYFHSRQEQRHQHPPYDKKMTAAAAEYDDDDDDNNKKDKKKNHYYNNKQCDNNSEFNQSLNRNGTNGTLNTCNLSSGDQSHQHYNNHNNHHHHPHPHHPQQNIRKGGTWTLFIQKVLLVVCPETEDLV